MQIQTHGFVKTPISEKTQSSKQDNPSWDCLLRGSDGERSVDSLHFTSLGIVLMPVCLYLDGQNSPSTKKMYHKLSSSYHVSLSSEGDHRGDGIPECQLHRRDGHQGWLFFGRASLWGFLKLVDSPKKVGLQLVPFRSKRALHFETFLGGGGFCHIGAFLGSPFQRQFGPPRILKHRFPRSSMGPLGIPECRVWKYGKSCTRKISSTIRRFGWSRSYTSLCRKGYAFHFEA